MGKKRKKRAGQRSDHPVDKRPGELVAVLVIIGASVLISLYQWYAYAGVVGGNSLPVPAEFLPTYRIILLLAAFVTCLIWIFLFLGLKIGFWTAAVFFSLNLLGRILELNLFGILMSALYLYLLLCQSTRIYFRIGQFKALGPREK